MKTRPTPRPRTAAPMQDFARQMRLVGEALGGKVIPPMEMTDAQLDQWKLDSWNRSRRLRAMNQRQGDTTALVYLAAVVIAFYVIVGLLLLAGQYL